MVLTFDVNGGGSFMTGDLTVKLSRETTTMLSALNLPWYFEKEADPHFYLAGSMHWSTTLSLNATLPTSALFLFSFHQAEGFILQPSSSHSFSVKAALRAIRFRSSAIGQFSMLISLSIQGEHDFDVRIDCFVTSVAMKRILLL